jgi:hypothetical protein
MTFRFIENFLLSKSALCRYILQLRECLLFHAQFPSKLI